ncbi:hypothetical protein LWI29_015087 [Acer saccharum]|uniref:Uncharacterized protein n=1 Tax=Acer saccharum TaxID=4024 RepID=A0AA39SSJ6_ACESA|nr:hypothetical protein LWI29_015087 [Acer saccharum]
MRSARGFMKTIRNQVVHGLVRQDVGMVVQWSRDYLTEIDAVTAEEPKVKRGLAQEVIKRRPPGVGYYKVNTDAALDLKGKRVGLGLVIRDCHGNVC